MKYVDAILNSHELQQWSLQFVVILFLAGGVALLAIGLGLLCHSAGTLRFFDTMNRRVSMRRVFKSAETPRDTRQAVHKYRRWLAAAFVVGGVFALYGLITQFSTDAVIFVFGLDFFKRSFASWVVESARWLLIAGNLVAIVVGSMLVLFPDALAALEARGGRWISQRQLARNADTMNLTLDKLVAAFPRTAGLILTFFALLLIGTFGFMLTMFR